MQHPASVDAYIRAGWSLVPIPPGTKGPTTPGWNQKQNAVQSQHQLPPGWGIGLAHAYSGTMALDIDEWTTASFILLMHGIDLHALYDAPDAVIVDSGRAGRGKLLYAMPFGLSLASKKVNSDGHTIYELRSGTSNGLTVQDVLPPSIHPDTGQPYRWAGRGHWTRLPMIPQPLLDLWMSMLTVEAPQPTAPTSEIDWSEIMSAMGAISPDCSRDEWIKVGMALHHAGTESGDTGSAFQMWDQWSQPSGKYPGEREMATQWRSFRSDKSTTVRLGTLFQLARQAGWSKPPVDVTELFKGTVPTDPVKLSTSLRPPPPQINLDLIPPILRDYATKIAVSVGCDPMIPLWAGVAAVSGAMDARSRLEIKPGFKVPPVLWVLTIGEPAGKKTHGSSPMFDLLHTLEKEDRPRYAQAMQKFEALEARHESAKKAFLDAAKDTDLMLAGELPHGYGDPPAKPTPLSILLNDTTSQKMVRQVADNQRGMLAYLDEMLKWCENVTDKRSSEDRSAWTRAYEAGWYQMDRVGAGTITAENFAVSFYGNLQPNGFKQVMEPMAIDGMLQRFIPVMVQSEMSHKGRPDRDNRARDAYEMMIRSVFGLPAMTYTMSAEATHVFDSFQDWYYQRMNDERLIRSGELFMTAMGKLEGLVGRISLVWHVMHEPFATTISGGTMRAAVEVVRSYVIPSLRHIYESEVGGFDQWCADYVIQYADHTEITMSMIRRSARRQIEGMSHWNQVDRILTSMYPLEKAGWVARVDGGEQKDGAKWAVNQELKTMFADHRKGTIEAKQRVMNDIYKLSPKDPPKVHGSELLDDSKAA